MAVTARHNRERLREILAKVTIYQSEDALLGELSRRRLDQVLVLAFLNQHAFNVAAANTEFSRSLLMADYLFRDGVGVELALKLAGKNPGINMNGTDLIPKLLAHLAPSMDLVVFGGQPDTVAGTHEALEKASIPSSKIVHGFLADAVYMDICKGLREPTLLVLAMGVPKQELLATKLAAILPAGSIVINGGAVFDFLAKRIRRAPLWMRRLKLEWLFRLYLEPVRLAGRYIAGGFLFFYRVLLAL